MWIAKDFYVIEPWIISYRTQEKNKKKLTMGIVVVTVNECEPLLLWGCINELQLTWVGK